jgi:hypothetical protein
VGNVFTARGVDAHLRLSNGATRVLFDVLALAGSAAAATPWQQWFTLHFCDCERQSSGSSGFDLDEVPWTADHAVEKAFVQHVLDLGLRRYGWERLHYDPPLVRDALLDLRLMLAAFAPEPVAGSWMGDWTAAPRPPVVDRCARHGVFRGELECRLCDVECQPLDAPRVWELVSRRTGADGRVTHREVVPVPDRVLPVLRWRIPLGALDPATNDRAPGGEAATWLRVEPAARSHVEAALGRPLDPWSEHLLRVAVA